MCVVFLYVTVMHKEDASPIAFSINRIVDTTIGLVVALAVNQFPINLKKQNEPSCSE